MHPQPQHPPGPGIWTAYAWLALSMSTVGLYIGLSKSLTAALPVFLLAWMRFGIAAVAMASWIKRPADEPAMTVNTKRLVFLESFIGNFMFSICMLYGVSMTSAVSAGVILSMIPAAIAIMSWLFLGERVGRRVWLAAVLGVIGIALLSLSRHGAGATGLQQEDFFGSKAMLGNALVFAAVLCEGVYATVGKKLTGSLSPKRISALINLWGFALMTPMGAWFAWRFDFAAVHSGVWMLLVFYALAASVWTVWMWMTGLQTVPAARAGVFSVLLPIMTALTGVVVYGERLGPLELLAFAIALAGVLLATLPGQSDPRFSDQRP